MINGQKDFNTQISIAPIRVFLHKSGENISWYFKTLDPLHLVDGGQLFYCRLG